MPPKAPTATEAAPQRGTKRALQFTQKAGVLSQMCVDSLPACRTEMSTRCRWMPPLPFHYSFSARNPAQLLGPDAATPAAMGTPIKYWVSDQSPDVRLVTLPANSSADVDGGPVRVDTVRGPAVRTSPDHFLYEQRSGLNRFVLGGVGDTFFMVLESWDPDTCTACAPLRKNTDDNRPALVLLMMNVPQDNTKPGVREVLFSVINGSAARPIAVARFPANNASRHMVVGFQVASLDVGLAGHGCTVVRLLLPGMTGCVCTHLDLGVAPNDDRTRPLFIGGFSMNLQELRVYQGALSEARMADVYEELQDRWGIPQRKDYARWCWSALQAVHGGLFPQPTYALRSDPSAPLVCQTQWRPPTAHGMVLELAPGTQFLWRVPVLVKPEHVRPALRLTAPATLSLPPSSCQMRHSAWVVVFRDGAAAAATANAAPRVLGWGSVVLDARGQLRDESGGNAPVTLTPAGPAAGGLAAPWLVVLQFTDTRVQWFTNGGQMWDSEAFSGDPVWSEAAFVAPTPPEHESLTVALGPVRAGGTLDVFHFSVHASPLDLDGLIRVATEVVVNYFVPEIGDRN